MTFVSIESFLLLVMLIMALLSTETGVGFLDEVDFFPLPAVDAAVDVTGVVLPFFDLLPDAFLDDSWLERKDGSSLLRGDGNSSYG